MRFYGTMEINKQGVLQIGGVSTVQLVREFGTPLLVLDEREIRSNSQDYLKAFNKYYSRVTITYAAKAFLNLAICKIIESEGLSLDVVSGGELFIALQAGFPAEKIYFHGNNKSTSELKMALEAGVGYFMVDNLQEARLLNMLASKQQRVKVILRVTPGIEAHTHEFIQTGQIDSKFGVSIYRQQALEVIKEILDMKQLELEGIHAHIGSQIFNLTSYAREVDVMLEFMTLTRKETGFVLKKLDLGGGLGIAYTENEEHPELDEYARMIGEKVQEKAAKLNFPLPEIIMEPGRSIIGTAGTTLYTIGAIKDIPAVRKYLAVDGGMTDNIRPALYGSRYEALLANKAYYQNEEIITVAGKCCESGDILIHDIKLPIAESGDILAISCTGAYTYAMASNYNGLVKPAIVLVNSGEAEVITSRESYLDLIKNDRLPDRLLF